MFMESVNNFNLEMFGISKHFPGVQALNNVDFNCRNGEVHAIVGENGAGKSTLIKILTGVYQKDKGKILLKGKPVEIPNRIVAQRMGINAIYQELNLIPKLTVAENVMLGNFAGPIRGLYSRQKNNKRAREIISDVLGELGTNLDPNSIVSRLSIAEQQLVAICKALSNESCVLVLDEVTAALRDEEIDRLFHVIRSLCHSGVSIIYITHRIDEVFDIADRVTILRDGEVVGVGSIESVSQDELVTMMIGRHLDNMYPKRPIQKGEVMLVVDSLEVPGLQKPINFNLHRGEILGIYGLMGGGQERLGESLFGNIPYTSGSILLNGKSIYVHSPKEAKQYQLGLIPIDRKSMGLVLPLSVTNNLLLTNVSKYARLGFVSTSREAQAADHWIHALRIQCPQRNSKIRDLSGGNQQKVIIARWLEANSKIFIMIEPTRGVDVGAKVEIYELIENACDAGAGVILISSDLPEVLALSDRILVMRDGYLAGEFPGGAGEDQKRAVLSCAMGGDLNGRK
jgi:ribose transport system ATP-binding protein